MILNQRHTPAQIFQFAADILGGMVPSGVVVIDRDRPQVLTLDSKDRTLGQVKVPCHLIIAYKDTRPVEPVVTCCVCQAPIDNPGAFKRFGKYPVCSAAHADAAYNPLPPPCADPSSPGLHGSGQCPTANES